LLERRPFDQGTILAVVGRGLGFAASPDLELAEPSDKVRSRVPRLFCDDRCLLPLELTEGMLTVAVSDVPYQALADEARFVSGYRVRFVLAGASGIRQAIQRIYDGMSTPELDDLDFSWEAAGDGTEDPDP